MTNAYKADGRRNKAPALWFPLIMAMISYILVGINTYRMQPVLTSLMRYMAINEGSAGVLMSVSSFVALALTIPMGFVVMRIGCKAAVVIAMLFQIAGSLVGYLFTTFPGVLCSQLLLGLTNTMVLVTAPTFLQLFYHDKQYSAVIGLLNSSQTMGMCVAFLLIPRLILSFSLPAIWLVTLYPAILFALAWFFTVQNDRGSCPGNALSAQTQDGETPEAAAAEGVFPLRDRNMWLLSLGAFCVMLSAGAVLNFASAYLTAYRGITETAAGNITFSCCLVGVFASAGAGWFCRYWGKRGVYLFIIFFLTLLRILPVIAPDGVALFIVIALQGVPAAGIVAANAAIPDLCVTPRYRALAVSMVAMATTGGLALSSVVFGSLVTAIGYHGAFLVFVPISLAGVVGALPMRGKTS